MDTLDVSISTAVPAGWDDYVRGHADASAYHQSEFVRVGFNAFRLKCYFLTAKKADGRICGVLPLIEQPGLTFKRNLVSVPFFNYGGALVDDDAALLALGRAAENLAAERFAKQVELRHTRSMPALEYPVSLDKVSMILTLPQTAEAMSKQLGSKLRSQVKRADRESPEVRVGGTELLGDFYTVFCSVMRDLGTPVYPQKFFRTVLAAAGDQASIVAVYIKGEPVGAAFLVRWRDGIEVPWAATLGSVKALSINMRLYWELLQHAIATGCKTFDFGRSTLDSGTYKFKSQWGAQPVQLHWQHWSRDGSNVSERLSTRDSLSSVVRMWSKLPLPIANWLGPHISPKLPW